MRMSNFTFQQLSGAATDLSIAFYEYRLATFCHMNDLLSHESDTEKSLLSDGGIEK